MKKMDDQRKRAAQLVLRALRNPIILLSVPERAEILALIETHQLTAAELVELSLQWVLGA